MRTEPSPGNPWGPTRHGYAFEAIRRAAPSAHLDFGCYDGDFLASLAALRIPRLHGVDADGDAVERGRHAHPGLGLGAVAPDQDLPFADGSFDSASLLDVYEHLDVETQKAVLGELWRVLRLGGLLVVTVPRRNALSFLDLGNVKFRFPRLHRALYVRLRGRAEYDIRYGSNPFGLVGDVMTTKRWHEHFSPAGLERSLGSAGFVMTDVDGSGLFVRLVLLLHHGIPSATVRGATNRLIEADARAFASSNLFATFRKVGANSA